ncbi:MAG: hypothetical protein ACK4IS_12020 [Erythrobacter sp.]
MDFAQGSQTDIFGAAGANPQGRKPLAAHPAFAPTLGLWGAGVGLAMALVLPVAVVEAVAGIIPLDLAPQAARFALAGSCALALALAAYGTGRAISRRHGGSAAQRSARAAAREPIDPASELGSDSFDAPLPAGLFEQDTAWLPEPPAAEALAAEAAEELAAARDRTAPQPAMVTDQAEDDPAPPRALDLADFAALPGRNAVWVNEPAIADDHEDPAAFASATEPAGEPNPDPALVSAIARLRAVSPSELSLCEMVERFAAALRDYQAAQETRSDSAETRKEREAMLHEALGALGQVTGEALADRTEDSGPARRARLWAEAETARGQRGAA